ncbi:MAG: hypothetical protein ACR2F6_06485 [Mycobacteriales bacterium]
MSHVVAAAAAALSGALDAAPRLTPGADLRAQRRSENRAAASQLRSHLRAIGSDDAPRFPFACECGRSGCGLVWEGTWDEYDAASESEAVRAKEHA